MLQYSLLVCSSTAFTYLLLAHSAHLRCFVLTYQCQQKTSGNYLGLGDTMPSTYRFKSESYPKANSNYVSEQFILTFVTKASLCQDELFGYASNLLQNDSRLSKKKKKKKEVRNLTKNSACFLFCTLQLGNCYIFDTLNISVILIFLITWELLSSWWTESTPPSDEMDEGNIGVFFPLGL